MAKTIIIIEDTDKATESFEIKVLKFQTPEELEAAYTSAILIGDEIAAALTHSLSKLRAKATAMPMHSTARH